MFLLTTALQSKQHYLHFTTKKTEAQEWLSYLTYDTKQEVKLSVSNSIASSLYPGRYGGIRSHLLISYLHSCR